MRSSGRGLRGSSRTHHTIDLDRCLRRARPEPLTDAHGFQSRLRALRRHAARRNVLRQVTAETSLGITYENEAPVLALQQKSDVRNERTFFVLGGAEIADTTLP